MATTRTTTAANLKHGDTLIHDDQRVTITGVVSQSDTWHGSMCIEVDFGVLYIPTQEQVTIVDDNDDHQARAVVNVGPNGSVTDQTNAHHTTTATGTPVATKLALAVPEYLATEEEIVQWVGHTAQRIITAAGPGTTLTVHVGDGQ